MQMAKVKMQMAKVKMQIANCKNKMEQGLITMNI